VKLKKLLVKSNHLSRLNIDGTAYAFTRLTLEKLGLQDLGGVLDSFTHL